jgi:inositol-phosphate transport system substrate-binding protein
MKRFVWVGMFIVALLLVPATVFSAAAPKPGPRTVRIWAFGSTTEGVRTEGAVRAAKVLNDELKKEGKNITITVDPWFGTTNWADYRKKFTLAADAGEAPEIYWTSMWDISTWVTADAIVPIADSVSKVKRMHPQFNDVMDALWDACVWNGKVYATPQGTDARLMYYSIPKLKALGWSDAKIAALPESIRKGEFTLDDLIATAKEAVDKGIVQPGYGYWHRPSAGGDFYQYYAAYGGTLFDPKTTKLVVVKDALEKWFAFQRKCVDAKITPEKFIGTDWNIWHDVVTHDKALFWNAGAWSWNGWATVQLKNEGGEATLLKNVGYGLQPSGVKGKNGLMLSHAVLYALSSPKASGGKVEQDLLTRLLALMLSKDIVTDYCVANTCPVILKSQADEPRVLAAKFLSSISYTGKYNFYIPSHSQWGAYDAIVWKGMVAAEQGEKTPAAAAEEVVKLLKQEIGDSLIVK